MPFSIMRTLTAAALLSAFVQAQVNELPLSFEWAGELNITAIGDDRPTSGSAKHAAWLGDWNGDGIPEYFVTTKKGGTSSFFYSHSNNTWSATDDWYLPSYSVIALSHRPDNRPEYIIKTSKYQNDDRWPHTSFADHVDGLGSSYTTVLRIPDDPVNDPLEVVMTFPRAVPLLQGCLDIDGDGYKDLLVTHHVKGAPFVASYYKGKDASADGKPFESNHQWASDGSGTSMGPQSVVHKARWGDLQVIDADKQKMRLIAAGAEDVGNHVIYWNYDKNQDTFDATATVLNLTDVPEANDGEGNVNELRITSVRALPGALMLAGADGAHFFKYRNGRDEYLWKQVPGILPGEGYSDFWCLPAGNIMVFVILREPNGNQNAILEFRTFDPSIKPSRFQISDILHEIEVTPKAQRIRAR